MKKSFFTPVRSLLVIAALLFVVFWSVWFYCYRHYLIWLEGYSFFSTLPDFASQYFSIKEGLPGYIGAFLHQFYHIPLLGAAIQSLLTVIPAFCLGIILIRLFKNPEAILWVSVIPLAFITYRQFWDFHLYYTVTADIASLILMVLTLAVTAFVKPEWKVPERMGNIYLNMALTVVAASVSVWFIARDENGKRTHEEYTRLEYLGENRRWDDILDTVSPKDARTDELKRAYALLALSESGLLTEHAFRYGLQGESDFVFTDKISPLCLNYNALFYQCNDMYNAVIHQAYQQGVQSVTGVSFSSLRRLADTYIELKDYDLARKYVDILSHSSCHKAWVKERLPQLEAIRNVKPEYAYDEYKATISNFTHVISSMVDRNRDNRKYADLLLCSLLADQEGGKFKDIFRYVAEVQYSAGTPIPRLYEEALLMISTIDPQSVAGIRISADTRKRFADFAGLMNSGKGTQALRKYADTYWAYSY